MTSVQLPRAPRWVSKATAAMRKYMRFFGPGILVSVAYMDPGNYSTAVSGGASYEYRLLFIIIVSNAFAVVLQILSAKLGAVTGLNLAENCRKHLPRWLCISLYILTEIAIIATDLAEVVGTAIALNILLNIPLAVGVVLTVVDVMVVLAAYDPNGPIWVVRYFEYFVSALVAAVVACFCVELAKIHPEHPDEILRGFLPSHQLLEQKAVYLSCAILGATVMPHSLYLGSGIVQPRLKEYDEDHGRYSGKGEYYQPSLNAINYCMRFTIIELVVSLCTVALFVNVAILIVAGATMYKSEDAYDADLFSIYSMLGSILGPAAGTVFAFALLFSGQSAGVVCTLAGQMVSEGFIEWSVRPWIRRIITRLLAITPCLIMALFLGRRGLATVLNASQVVLSLLLPFVTAPLIYFVSSEHIMRVPVVSDDEQPENEQDISLSSQDESREDIDPAASDMRAAGSQSYLHLESGQLYKDLSVSRAMKITSTVIFALVSGLNLFLLASMAWGVPGAQV